MRCRQGYGQTNLVGSHIRESGNEVYWQQDMA